MTVEEILAALQAIVDAADGRSFTDAEVGQYEALERELDAVRKSNELRARNVAYNTPVNGGPAFIPFTSGFGSGRYLQLWLAVEQSVYQSTNAPEIRGAWIEYEIVGEQFDFPQDQAASIPART